MTINLQMQNELQFSEIYDLPKFKNLSKINTIRINGVNFHTRKILAGRDQVLIKSLDNIIGYYFINKHRFKKLATLTYPFGEYWSNPTKDYELELPGHNLNLILRTNTIIPDGISNNNFREEEIWILEVINSEVN